MPSQTEAGLSVTRLVEPTRVFTKREMRVQSDVAPLSVAKDGMSRALSGRVCRDLLSSGARGVPVMNRGA